MRNFFDRKGSGGSRRTDSRGGYGGGSRFGGANRGGGGYRGGAGGDRPAMHSAICSECNANCEVPFKPNGRKPVLCQECFRKDDSRDSAPRSSAQSFDRIGSFEKPAYKSTPHTGNEAIEKQLKALNQKVDQILKALTDIGEEGEDEDEDEEEGEE